MLKNQISPSNTIFSDYSNAQFKLLAEAIEVIAATTVPDVSLQWIDYGEHMVILKAGKLNAVLLGVVIAVYFLCGCIIIGIGLAIRTYSSALRELPDEVSWSFLQFRNPFYRIALYIPSLLPPCDLFFSSLPNLALHKSLWPSSSSRRCPGLPPATYFILVSAHSLHQGLSPIFFFKPSATLSNKPN